MAATLEGRRLTDAHRIGQVSIAAQAAASTLVLADELLDPFDLDRNRDRWLTLGLGVLQSYAGQAERLAAAYVQAFREVEGADVARMRLAGIGQFDLAGAAAALDAVVSRAKRHTALGEDPRQAVAGSAQALLGAHQRNVLDAGRAVVDESALASGNSWRRVTDGRPCKFCAMLASRGPVYSSARTAGRGRRYHGYCGCTVEEFYGNWEDWEPTEAEQWYIDEYERAAEEVTGARTENAVLSRMGEPWREPTPVVRPKPIDGAEPDE